MGKLSCRPCVCLRARDLNEIITHSSDDLNREALIIDNSPHTGPTKVKDAQKNQFDLLLLIIKLQRGFRAYRNRKKKNNETTSGTSNEPVKIKTVMVDIEDFNNDRWDKFFSKVTVEIQAVPDLITNFYNKLFENYEENIKMFSIKIEDYELKEGEEFSKKFKIPILRYISNFFNLGPHDEYISSLKVYDEGLLENLGSGIGTIYHQEKGKHPSREKNDVIYNVDGENSSPIIVRKSQTELININNGSDGYKSGQDSRIQREISDISTQLITKAGSTMMVKKEKEKKVSFKNMNGLTENIEITVTDRDKLPRIFSKEFNKEDKDKEKPTEFNNDLILQSFNLRMKKNQSKSSGQSGKGLPQEEGPKYIYSFKFICEEMERNDKENITEEKVIFSKEDSTYYKGTFHVIFEEKYGFGTQYMINKNQGHMYKYRGFFSKNKFHGYGILQGEAGYLYYGEFRNGLQCGFGVEISDAGVYTGLFLNGKYQGYGEFVAKNRKYSYVGCYDKGFKEGLGFLDYDDKSKYIGNFKLNQMSGSGFFCWVQGHKYYGSWKLDKMQGRGKYVWKTGDIYIGPYDNDKKHGEGVYIYHHNNAELRGTWKNGNKEGRFMLRESPNQQFFLKFKKDQQVE